MDESNKGERKQRVPVRKKNGNSVVFNRGRSMGILWERRARSTIFKTRASVSSGYPNNE